MYNPYNLKDKTILVTGASSGIGRATAIECSKLGAKLIITARNEDRLKETLNSLEGEGHQMFLADLSDSAAIELLVNEVSKIDGFSCNACVSNTQPIPFYKEEEIERIFKTNTFSMMMLTKFLVKKKKLNNYCAFYYSDIISKSI